MKDHLIGSVPAHLVDAARPTLTAHEGLVADCNIRRLATSSGCLRPAGVTGGQLSGWRAPARSGGGSRTNRPPATHPAFRHCPPARTAESGEHAGTPEVGDGLFPDWSWRSSSYKRWSRKTGPSRCPSRAGSLSPGHLIEQGFVPRFQATGSLTLRAGTSDSGQLLNCSPVIGFKRSSAACSSLMQMDDLVRHWEHERNLGGTTE